MHQSSDVTIEEIIGVQVINEERLYDSHVVVFDAMVQTEKEENSSGDASNNLVEVVSETLMTSVVVKKSKQWF